MQYLKHPDTGKSCIAEDVKVISALEKKSIKRMGLTLSTIKDPRSSQEFEAYQAVRAYETPSWNVEIRCWCVYPRGY